MAVAAFWHSRMLGLVAVCTIQVTVLCLTLAQHFIELGVAGTAIFGRCVICVVDIKGTVRLVAAETVFINHEFGMRLMTGQAFMDLLMLGGVTERTVLLGVFARELGKLVAFICMTGFTDDADSRHVVHGDIKGSMGVSVAAKAHGTISKGKMFVF